MDLSAISMWWVVLPQRLMSMRTGCPEATPAWPLETIREAPRRGVASPTAAGGHSMVRGCRLDSGDWRARFQGSPGDSAPPTERRLRPCRNTNLPPLQRLCERHLFPRRRIHESDDPAPPAGQRDDNDGPGNNRYSVTHRAVLLAASVSPCRSPPSSLRWISLPSCPRILLDPANQCPQEALARTSSSKADQAQRRRVASARQ